MKGIEPIALFVQLSCVKPPRLKKAICSFVLISVFSVAE